VGLMDHLKKLPGEVRWHEEAGWFGPGHGDGTGDRALRRA
jgi:hypothetical protein